MSQLPTWVQYLSALGTPIIALMVAAVAFLQWRTGHQNVVLQLFERRIEMIENLRGAIALVLRGGYCENKDSHRFLIAMRGTEFLFRSDVTSYLDEIYKVLLNLHVCDSKLKSANGTERHELIEKRRKLRDILGDFFPIFNKLVGPYVQMHQKHLWI